MPRGRARRVPGIPRAPCATWFLPDHPALCIRRHPLKANILTMRDLFSKDVRYLVPAFQRPYVWTQEDQWDPLWDDVRNTAERYLDALQAVGRGARQGRGGDARSTSSGRSWRSSSGRAPWRSRRAA